MLIVPKAGLTRPLCKPEDFTTISVDFLIYFSGHFMVGSLLAEITTKEDHLKNISS